MKKKEISNEIREYFSKIGAKGGKKSRRILTPEKAREMVRIRTEKKKKKNNPDT